MLLLSFRHLLFGFALSLIAVPFALANTESLIKNSPFVPEGYTPSPSPSPGIIGSGKAGNRKRSGKLEFRGSAKIDGQWYFSIYETKKRRGYWVRMNDSSGEFLVTSYNPQDQSITVQDASGPQTLKLKEPSQRRYPGSALSRPLRSPANSAASKNNKTATPSSRAGQKNVSPRNSSSSKSGSSKSLPPDIPPELIPLFESLK
tara:strand:+ start:1863 stop:2471 length:609 start_codon:yes stop_codon:yes gene_type:complete